MALTGPDSPTPRDPSQGPPPDPDTALIESVAKRVVAMGLTAPAVFFLESTKPLSFVGSQALVFLEPFVKSFLNVASYDRFVALMEDRKNIERLIVRIEDLDEESRAAEKQRKKREREEKIARKKETERLIASGAIRRPDTSLRARLRRFLARRRNRGPGGPDR